LSQIYLPNAADSARNSNGEISPRTSLLIFLGLLLIGSARIAATYTVFNDTVDESQHIACGMQWLDQDVYRYEPGNPPLARVMAAIGPYLAGARSADGMDSWADGRQILNTGGHYDRNLALARLGIMPFFWLASAVVFIWTRRGFGNLAACFASLCFTNLPAVLAHAGLATTDMAATATTGAAFLALLMWAERASWWRTVFLGAAIAAAVLAKFTSLVFLPAAIFMALLCHLLFLPRPGREQFLPWIRSHSLPLVVALAIACGLIWAGYRFSFSGVPAPQLWQGFRDVMERNRSAYPSYLFGRYSEHGWWYYFPVALAVKTPLAFLGLMIVGCALCFRRRFCSPLAYALGILIFAMAFSHVNPGIRHVLPMFVGLSVVAGAAAQYLWSSGLATRAVLASLFLWMAVSSGLSHPDYLAYFNAFAGHHPEEILVDSDLDWGQDTKRLALRLKELGVKDLAFDPLNRGFVNDLQARHEFPAIHALSPLGPSPGWNAGNITKLKLWRLSYKDQLWTDRIAPTEHVGKGILLWYVGRIGD